MTRLDSFTLAVLHSSLVGVARDMKIMTMRTAYTEPWKEQGDLSCCLMDAAGDNSSSSRRWASARRK